MKYSISTGLLLFLADANAISAADAETGTVAGRQNQSLRQNRAAPDGEVPKHHRHENGPQGTFPDNISNVKVNPPPYTQSPPRLVPRNHNDLSGTGDSVGVRGTLISGGYNVPPTPHPTDRPTPIPTPQPYYLCR